VVPGISQNANLGLRSQLKDWKYVRLVRKWAHYSDKTKKVEKDVDQRMIGRIRLVRKAGGGLLVRKADD